MSPKRVNISDIRNKLNTESLPMPNIPENFRNKIYMLSPWCFTSWIVLPVSAYNINFYINEIQEKNVQPYFILEHAGHGVNSCALHNYIVNDRLALFMQIPWGGVYMDNKKQIEKIHDSFSRSAELVKLSMGKHTSEKRLVVYDSGFYGSKWAWQEKKVGEIVNWNEMDKSQDVLTAALKLLL